MTFLMQLPKLVVCAINGPVAGIGLAFALACDVRFAVRDAKVTTAFAKLGLVAEHTISWTLPQLVGTGNALKLLASGEVVTSQECYRMGMFQHLSEPGCVVDDAVAWASKLCNTVSPDALAVIKRQVWVHPHIPVQEASKQCDTMMMASLGPGTESKEGFKAFFEKRNPRFSGYSSSSALQQALEKTVPSKL
mmetsp:Transcript_20721/g.50782  ORF Transcript_20721/g.50782 Transcript_20721/m.50782 type:complete len:192 (+) Transcript_20721:194-769(+)